MMSATVERSLRLHGKPVSEADVVLVDGTRFAAAAATDADGRFALPDEPGTLLVRIRQPAIVVAAVPTGEREIDLRPKLCRLGGTIQDAAPPLTVYIDPVDGPGLTPALAAFILQRSAKVRSSHYVALQVAGDAFAVTVAAGRYRVTGNRLDYDRPMAVEKGPPSVAVGEIRRDGVPLPGDPWGGFTVEVDGDTELTLILREVADDEL
jgi:hypothetical protein